MWNICGLSCIGQVKFLTSISKFPILPFPLLYKKSNFPLEALFALLKSDQPEGPRGTSCVSTETPIKDL